MGRLINLTGQRIGRWTVGERGENDAQRKPRFHCKCDCGTEAFVRACSLRDGKSLSCGCLIGETASKRRSSHRHSLRGGSPTYRSWQAMRTRCLWSKANNFHDYGGRGISICERWESFENFLADMGERPAGTSIDRIDFNGNYEPGNCRWATRKEQNDPKNKRPRRDRPPKILTNSEMEPEKEHRYVP